MKPLNEAPHIGCLLNEAKRGPKSNFRDNIIGHVNGPGREVKLFTSFCEQLVDPADPVVHSCVYQWLHPLDVGKAILQSEICKYTSS